MRICRYCARRMKRSWLFQSATGSLLGVDVQAMSSFCPPGPVNRSPAAPVETSAPLPDPSVSPSVSSSSWLALGALSPAPLPEPPPAPSAEPSGWASPPLSPSSPFVSALGVAPATVLSPLPPLAPSVPSSPPRVSASTVPSTASATTTALTISVPRGTTSVSGARRTGLGGRSGGVITGHPELRPPEPDFVPCPVPPACRPAPAPEAADPGEDGDEDEEGWDEEDDEEDEEEDVEAGEGADGGEEGAGGAVEADAAGAADAVEAAAGVPIHGGPGTVPEPEAAVSPAVLARAARAAPAAPAAAAILR